jgi:hypothetical protein
MRNLLIFALFLSGCAGNHIKIDPRHAYVIIGQGLADVPLAAAAGVPVQGKGCFAILIQRCGTNQIKPCMTPAVSYDSAEGCRITIGVAANEPN